MASTLKIGWFSTGRGPGSRGLLQFVQERILAGRLPVSIQFVFCNRQPGEAEGSDQFMERVKAYGIPLVTFSSRGFRRQVGGRFADHRLEYDREVMGRIAGYQPDVSVLAGYMLIVGPEMCHRYTMLNLHPALPGGPAGTWQDVIWQLIESQATETGAMMHLVTEELDQGPVVSYFTLSIMDRPFQPLWNEVQGKTVEELKQTYGEELPLFRLIRQEEYRREPHLLVTTLSALVRNLLKLEDRKVLDAQGSEISELNLTQEVERALSQD